MRMKMDHLNILEKVLSKLLKKYTYKIYRKGVIYGYNWAKNNKDLKK